MPDERRAMSIDDCVKTEAQECARPYSNLIPFFCGSSRYEGYIFSRGSTDTEDNKNAFSIERIIRMPFQIITFD